MDGLQLFRKLSVGAKFDFKRFRADAERLKIISSTPKELPDIPGAPVKCEADISKTKTDFPKKRKGEPEEKDSPKKKKHQENEDISTDSSDDRISSSSDSEAESDASSADVEQIEGSKDLSPFEQATDSDEELQLLGKIKSSGKQDKADTLQAKKKKKKKKKKELSEAELQEREVMKTRKQHKIHVTGSDIPKPFTSFVELGERHGLHQTIMTNIESVGYHTPTPIQMQAMPVMIQRRDIMACAPTGSGKTAAFILPILHHLKEPQNVGFRAVVLSPTRELAKQTYNEFHRLSEGLGFRMYYIEKPAVAVKRLGQKSKHKFDILVTTPNRLIYIMEKHPDIVSLSSVEWLVVDESDKLFEAGKRGFRDQLGVIYKACDSPRVRRAMFSATFAHDVEEWCKLNLDNVIQVYVGLRNSATETIDQELVFVGSEHGKLLAVRQLIQKGIQPPVLIFVQSKERAKELFRELIYDKVNVDVIHADRTQLERDNIVKSFRVGKIWVLICTELLGRGMDFKGVNLVINYDFPYSAISYIHRIGRTGRAGRRGRAITYFTENDSVYLRSIANVMKQAGCPVPDYMLNLPRPNKQERRRMAHTAPHRKPISRASKYDKEQQKIQEKARLESLYKKKSRKEKKDNKSAKSGKQDVVKGDNSVTKNKLKKKNKKGKSMNGKDSLVRNSNTVKEHVNEGGFKSRFVLNGSGLKGNKSKKNLEEKKKQLKLKKKKKLKERKLASNSSGDKGIST